MRLLLLFLLLPASILAQEVKPILSKDYFDLINNDSGPVKNSLPADTSNSIKNSFYLSRTHYDGHSPIRKILITKNGLTIQPVINRVLLVGGNFSTTAEVKTINRVPALQTQYVQGRSQNGALVWKGPETGELFSYGPAISTLEFNNSPYAYDVNGRLVPAGTGSGKKANAYGNSIFRTATLTKHSLHAQGKYLVRGKQVLAGSIKLGQERENLVIKNNKNKTGNLSASLEVPVKWLTATGAYTASHERFSNPNRNGFLNRVYQNSLLTPVSFANNQGYSLGNAQRSYSSAADNPYFLLENNDNSFFQSQQTGSLALERKISKFKFKIMQSVESVQQTTNEVYKPGTAFFPAGMAINRRKDDMNHLLRAAASYDVLFENYAFRSVAGLNYSYGNNKTTIRYTPGNTYRYQRSSHDLALSYLTTYSKSYFEGGLNLVNKIYTSNTNTTDNFFLPGVSGYARFDDVLGAHYLSAKLVGSFSTFNSELPVDRSFSQSSLLQYSTQQGLQYLPVLEAAGFDQLAPIRHKEWTARLELSYQNKISLQAEVFTRNTKDDIFPEYSNGMLQLKNMADHRNKGIELNLNLSSYLWNAKKIITNSSVSFFKYQNTVTHVKNGYNFTPIAGFSNVNKALIEGEALGVITGNSYEKDGNNNRKIGNDGFPLVNAVPSVIGNPIPDFVLKMSHTLNWKSFYLNLDLEWKKGGDIWNGTQAVLDYYGRSENSASLRNTTNYVFGGSMSNGHPNNIPVTFYDPALPIENNRWVRYGYSGVAEDYIRKADHIRLNNIGLCYKVKTKKYLQYLAFTLYADNIIIWTPYKGADPNQLLYEQPYATGLDFFNLPSTKTFGLSISLQF